MKTINEIRNITATQEYDKHFWNAMRLNPDSEVAMRDAMDSVTGTYFAPTAGETDLRKVVVRESIIRPLATNLKKYRGGSVIWAADSHDYASFVPEGAPIPGFDVEEDFTRIRVGSHKIACLLKLSEEFALDADFDLKKYISERMGKSFAYAEDKAFICGSGVNEPFGLLHDTEGAKIGTAVSALTYDAVIDLFFSVKPEYRTHAAWLMNDRTATALRKLKDDSGNYLWNSSTDTVLGKPIRICNELPDIAAGAKPVLFGDFRYYWIVDRSPVSMKALKERFAMSGRVGYVAFELLDARLVRRDAVKAISVIEESV